MPHLVWKHTGSKVEAYWKQKWKQSGSILAKWKHIGSKSGSMLEAKWKQSEDGVRYLDTCVC
jgi:hypothetical protein